MLPELPKTENNEGRSGFGEALAERDIVKKEAIAKVMGMIEHFSHVSINEEHNGVVMMNKDLFVELIQKELTTIANQIDEKRQKAKEAVLEKNP